MEKGYTQKMKYRTAEQEEMRKFIIVVVVVTVLVVGIYFLTRAVVTKDLFDKKNETTTKVEVKYDVAIVGEILNRPYDEYYVFVYDQGNEKASEMSSLVEQYKGTEKALHVYKVYLENKLNAKYYDPTKENTKATKVSEFIFGDTTLLKIKDGKVEKYITDYTKMEKELGISK